MKMQLSLVGAIALIVALSLNRGQADVHYVDVANPTPVSPYTNWATASTNIQLAVDVAVAGDEVVVTNGTYTDGGRRTTDVATNRVAIEKPLAVLSVNGPAVTVISGAGQTRGVYLGENATLIGFTVSGGWLSGVDGGGVKCLTPSALVSNCTFSGNTAANGGAAFGGTFRNCTFVMNAADSGGGAYQAVLFDCLVLSNRAGYNGYGSGTYQCRLERCTLAGNGYPFASTFFTYGGAAAFGSLANCTIRGNTALHGGGTYQANVTNCLLSQNLTYPGYQNQFFGDGGGANGGTLVNCTIVDNAAVGGSDFGPCSHGGGAAYANLINCILYRNSSFMPGPITPYPPWNDIYSCGVINSFVTYLSSGYGPGLGLDYRLLSNSICINAGNNAYVATTTDLDGNPRIVGGTVDQGAFESQSPTMLGYFNWLESYGLPTGNEACYLDSDGDGMNNWQEWRTWTIPTNSVSVFRMLSPLNTQTGLVIGWLSVPGKLYSIERCVSLTTNPIFTVLAGGLTGQTGTTSYIDANSSTNDSALYRASVLGP